MQKEPVISKFGAARLALAEGALVGSLELGRVLDVALFQDHVDVLVDLEFQFGLKY